MNKKILSVVLGGTIALASVLAFAGCGHKHNYEISYQLVDCDTQGYTLHTCTDCGYKYADEFIEPYGHAYRPYYHLEDDSDVQTKAVSVALTSENLGDGHHSLFTCLSEEQLNKLYAYAEAQREQNFCEHIYCDFCKNPGADELSRIYTTSEFFQKLIESTATQNERRMTFNIASTEFINGRVTPKNTLRQSDLQNLFAYISPTNNLHGDLIIPDSIIEVEDFDPFIAMQNNYANRFDRVRLSSNIKTIGRYAFYSSSMQSIVIPRTLTKVGFNAFGNCKDLKVIFYLGTEYEWNNIQLDAGNDALKNATVYYYNPAPTKSGNYWYYYDGEPTIRKSA